MDYILTNQLRVLAIDPSTKGIGFVVLEGPERLVDWGIKQAEGETDDAKNAECAKIVADLIDRYRPRILALEDAAADDSRRCERVEKLLAAIRQLAREKRVKVLDFTPERVRKAFTPTKDVVAAAIAGRFPELGPRLPKPRTLTMSEQYEMPVFDAMAFAQAYFYFRNRKRLSEERKPFYAAGKAPGSAGGTAECRFKGAWRGRMKQSLVLLLQRRAPWQLCAYPAASPTASHRSDRSQRRRLAPT